MTESVGLQVCVRMSGVWTYLHIQQEAHVPKQNLLQWDRFARVNPNSQQNGPLTPNHLEELIQRFYYGLKF